MKEEKKTKYLWPTCCNRLVKEKKPEIRHLQKQNNNNNDDCEQCLW